VPADTAKIAKAQQAFARGARSGLPDCGHGFVALQDSQTGEVAFLPIRCHKWACPYCSTFKLLEAQATARAGHPQRHIVLTLKPRPEISLKDQVAFIRSKFRLLVERIRRTHGPFQYMAALELQKNGPPHLHILARGPYVSQRWLAGAWRRLTGAFIVHVGAVTRTENAVRELTKYLAKTAAALAEQLPGLSVFTTSDAWPLDPPERDPAHSEHSWISLHVSFDLQDLTDALKAFGSDLSPHSKMPGLFAAKRSPPPSPAQYEAVLADVPLFYQEPYQFAYYLLTDSNFLSHEADARLAATREAMGIAA